MPTILKNLNYDLTCEVAEDECGMTLKGVLRRQKSVSTRLIRRIIHGAGVHGEQYPQGHGGGVYLNGKEARFADKVTRGDIIGMIYPSEQSGIEPEDIKLNVIYEDSDMLVLDKQHGIVVHPTKGHPCGTIANGIMKYMAGKGESWRPRFANRLDMDTSGVLLIGKNSHVQNHFTLQAKRGMIDKVYRALLSGIITEDSGIIDLPIAQIDGAAKRTVCEDGAASITRFKVLERFYKDEIKLLAGEYTYVELTIETGRTHQIRVHLSHLGHPVISDALYGIVQPELITRQALHACSLTLAHPRSGEQCIFNAPLPEDMAELLIRLQS
jgi:23S rRNA pseudouridine1911/1915/1917 synthase